MSTEKVDEWDAFADAAPALNVGGWSLFERKPAIVFSSEEFWTAAVARGKRLCQQTCLQQQTSKNLCSEWRYPKFEKLADALQGIHPCGIWREWYV